MTVRGTVSEAIFRLKLVIGLFGFGWLAGGCGYIYWAMGGDIDLPTLVRALPIAWGIRSFHIAAFATAVLLPALALLAMRKPRSERGLPEAPPPSVRKPW